MVRIGLTLAGLAAGALGRPVGVSRCLAAFTIAPDMRSV
jgi:hypothetical protein